MSCHVPSGLYLNCWHALMKSHPGGVLLCTSWALFELLICFHEILSSQWVVCLLHSIWIANILLWNPIQLVSCLPPGLYLNLTFHHIILFRMWVAVCLLVSFWISDMSLWNSMQTVSCCISPGLYPNCWHATITSCLVCTCLLKSIPFTLFC